ncbi:MAG TPA: aldehyde dehydrogenase family protein, partial [Dietzia sp.]|nr:aldehyde dehydrogenase family protein [Dietzia sp.]
MTSQTIGSAAAPSPAETVDRLKAAFRAGRTRPVEWRETQLRGLLRFLDEREGEIAEALARELGRSAFEAWFGAIAPPRNE